MEKIISLLKKNNLYIFFFFLLIISSPAVLDSFSGIMLEHKYAFNELFINYQFGFIRRGLFGEIFFQIYKKLEIDPKKIFPYIFLLLHLILIFLYFLQLKKWKNYSFLLVLIILSPALNLFYIYEREAYFIKDIFSNIIIFLHSYLASKLISNKITKKKYDNYLKFIIIPLLIISSLVHELQIFYISIHILFSIICFEKNLSNNSILRKILKIYGIIIVPVIFLFVYRGHEHQASQLIQLLVNEFGIEIHQQIYAGKNYGTFLTLLGNFFVWHFYYFDYSHLIIFILSFSFSVIFLFWLLEYSIDKKIITISKNVYKIYKRFFLLCFIPFFLTDHGRTMSLFAHHIVAFFVIFRINANSYNLEKKIIEKNFFLKRVIIIVIFFYIGLWSLSLTAGLKSGGYVDPVFESGLYKEMQMILTNSYDFIRINLIKELPRLPR